MSKLFWVSYIVQHRFDSKPWCCAVSTGCQSLEDAMKEIEFKKKNFRILSAWIDTLEDDIKTTVFHECYIDALGCVDGE